MDNRQENSKILIIRLSSFGDIVQAMSVLRPLSEHFNQASIHWLVRSDNVSILPCSDNIDHIWSFERKAGLRGLLKLALELRRQRFTHVYDAHSNLRSRVVCLFLSPAHFVRRSKERLKRFLLFNLRVNKFPKPYRGMMSFLAPLQEWGISQDSALTENWHFDEAQKKKCESLLGAQKDFVILVASAAWEMKRWPLEHWKQLIELCPEQHFILLGGTGDTFLEDLVAIAPERVKNLAGKLSLAESCYVVTLAQSVISADTGLLHVADLLGIPAIALIGPTAFGFPSNSQVKILETQLACRPCTKDGSGKCIQDVYQKCLVDLSPALVASELRELSAAKPSLNE